MASPAIVTLRLERDQPGGPIRNGRIAIETVEGRSVWRGGALSGETNGVLARADVPSSDLQRGDYIVRLFEGDASGAQHERGRYYLRIR